MPVARVAKRAAARLWYLRSRTSWLNFPIPVRLPYGGWFLAYGDTVGVGVAGYRFAGHPYEEGEWKFLRRLLRPGDVIVDVGANQGFFTILASMCVGGAGIVYAFEPTVSERRKLLRNLRVNHCENVVVESVAVGATDGIGTLTSYGWHQGSFSSLRPAASDVVAPGARLAVPVVTLDGWAAGRSVEHVRALKIDVEGGELDVLRGARAFLEHRPIILCETQTQRTTQWGYAVEDLLAEVTAAGYIWFVIGRDGDLSLYELGSEVPQNMAAVPREMAAEISRREPGAATPA